MRNVDFPDGIRQTGDNIVIVRPHLAESVYFSLRKVDVNPSPTSLVENKSIRDIERIVCAGIKIDAFGMQTQLELTEGIGHRTPEDKVASEAGLNMNSALCFTISTSSSDCGFSKLRICVTSWFLFNIIESAVII
jgi:hypothetical protein